MPMYVVAEKVLCCNAEQGSSMGLDEGYAIAHDDVVYTLKANAQKACDALNEEDKRDSFVVLTLNIK